MSPVDDDVIPTAIVIKNIPFSVGRETLLSVIESLGAPLPYAFNYHHDQGVFRGLAFANFRAPDEAASVVAALNGYDVQGRKLRVEYKKVLQPGEKDKIEREKALKRMRSIQFGGEPLKEPPRALDLRAANGNGNGLNGHSTNYDRLESPPNSASASSSTDSQLPLALDMNDPATLNIYSRVLLFKEDRMRDDLAFSRNLTPTERRLVHLVAAKLGLTSITSGSGSEDKYVLVTRDAPPPTRAPLHHTTSISAHHLSPYAPTEGNGLRIKKSMPDLRGFGGPVVARDPARSLTPQRSSGNLRAESREYVSMGAAHSRTFHTLFSGGDIPPVPPLPAGLVVGNRNSMPSLGENELAQPQPVRNPRGPTEGRGFGFGGPGTLRGSASQVLRVPMGSRVSEEGAGEVEASRTRESLDL